MRTITPLAALPSITDAVTIQAAPSNLTANANQYPYVRIDGASAGSVFGLDFNVAGVSSSSLPGVALTRWNGASQGAIRIHNTGTVIVTGTLLGTDQAGAAGLGNTRGAGGERL